MTRYTNEDRKAFLRKELGKYEVAIGKMTADERNELREWSANGNSVYDNPYLLYGENGFPMDYIQATRFAEDMSNTPDDYLMDSATESYTQEDSLPF